jgi:hypothetical protein
MEWSTATFRALPPDLRVDAEYYAPQYLQDSALFDTEVIPLEDAADVSDGNHLSISDSFADQGVRYLRGQDLTDFFVSDADPIYIPQREYRRLSRSHIFPGDVLLGIVGTIGSVALVTNRFRELTANCKIAILRPKVVTSEYLAAYLASSIGQGEIKRRIRGSVQTGLILPDIRTLPVPIPSPTTEERVQRFVQTAFVQRQRGIDLQAEAEGTLLSAVGIANTSFANKLFEVATFSETKSQSRLDSEFFQPKFHQLNRRLDHVCRSLQCSTIGKLSEPLRYGTSEKLEYVDRGIPFLRIADLRDRRFDLATVLRIPPGALKIVASATVRYGDVLVSRSGTLGIAVPIPAELDGAVFGSYFIRIRPDQSRLDPEFLALYLNSECGALQVERLTTGGVQTNLTIPAIEQFRIVLGDLSWQKKFVNLVARSQEAKNLSTEALKSAIATAGTTSIGVDS